MTIFCSTIHIACAQKEWTCAIPRGTIISMMAYIEVRLDCSCSRDDLYQLSSNDSLSCTVEGQSEAVNHLLCNIHSLEHTVRLY